MSKAFAFALAGDGTDTLELDVFSVIGESFWFDSVSASQVRRQLKANAKAKKIHLRVHSDGGDAFDAQAIYADLQAHSARVEADIMGLAASAATLIVMAADEIRIAEGAWFMIHDPWGGLMGTSNELRAWADTLDKMRATYAKAYAQRSGLSEADVLALMSAETWMTAAEAKSKGFVDSVVPMNAKAAASAGGGFAKAHRGALRSVAFAMASADYTNVPPALRAELEAAQLRGPNPPPPPAPAPEPQLRLDLGQPPEPPENDPMTTTAIPKSITAALNLVDGADEPTVASALQKTTARAGLFGKIRALAGVTADQSDDAVLGVLQAWKESAAKVPALEAKAAADKVAADKSELDALLEKGRNDKKLTKAKADDLRTKVEAGFKAKAEKRELGDDEWTLSQARSYVSALPVDAKLASSEIPAGGSGAPAPSANALTWEGKAYEQLTGPQAAALEQADPDLHKQMRADWEKRGEPEFKAA